MKHETVITFTFSSLKDPHKTFAQMYEDNALTSKYGCVTLMLYFFLITRISKSRFHTDKMYGCEIYMYADFIYNNKVQVRFSDFFSSVRRYFHIFRPILTQSIIRFMKITLNKNLLNSYL